MRSHVRCGRRYLPAHGGGAFFEMSEYVLIGIPGLIAVLALVSAFMFNRSVVRAAQGTDRMKELQGYIRSGAFTFMISEAKIMLITMAVIGGILWLLFYWQVAIAFWIGALLSLAAGFIGMSAATHANARTSNAARKSFKDALNVAFSGGSVMGLSVAGLALIGLVVVIFIFRKWFMPGTLVIETDNLLNVSLIRGALIVSAYSMGASLVALFDRVGGGIYTKAADMAADMVGKVEMGIPEDDPRNPATIADNVGDNVGDVGGLGADLLESFVGAIISVMVMVMYIYVGMTAASPDSGLVGLVSKLGLAAGLTEGNYWWVLATPLLVVGGGIIASLLAILYIRFSRRQEGMQKVLMNGTRLAAFLTAVTTFVVVYFSPLSLNVFWQVILGLVAGVGIGFFSEYFTSSSFKPTKELAKMNQSGPAVGVTEGMALGMMSTFMPVILIAAATIVSYQLGGLLGVAFTAMGMLSFVAMTVAVDTYGPIADNAGGISSMAELPPEVRERTDKLDSIGNTTAAIGKGFAIGSAAFAALGLIAAYMWSAASIPAEVVLPQLPIVGQILSPTGGDPIQVGAFVIAGLMLGAMVPYVFSALLIRGVSRTADILVQEVRRQFKEMPGIMSGEQTPDYNRCIEITAHGGLNKMFIPAMIAVGTPIVFGLIFGRYALGGFLIGALLSAIQLAIYCANAGGAMDNAKKYIEEGHFGGKNSEAHAAAVTGDTVGDPLKDTVGPSLDILIKLMSVIALVFASLFPLYPIFL